MPNKTGKAQARYWCEEHGFGTSDFYEWQEHNENLHKEENSK